MVFTRAVRHGWTPCARASVAHLLLRPVGATQLAARRALTPSPRTLGYGDRMDTQTPGKGLVVLDVFRRQPWGAGAAWSTGAAVLALGLAVLTTLVATGRTVGLDHWVDETMPPWGGGPAPLHFFAMAITTVANPPVTMALLLTVVAFWAIWSRTPWPLVAAAPAAAWDLDAPSCADRARCNDDRGRHVEHGIRVRGDGCRTCGQRTRAAGCQVRTRRAARASEVGLRRPAWLSGWQWWRRVFSERERTSARGCWF
jgi:hypothetical protein